MKNNPDKFREEHMRKRNVKKTVNNDGNEVDELLQEIGVYDN